MSSPQRVLDLTVDEFKTMLDQRIYDVSNRIIKDAIKPKMWLSAPEAMELLNCRVTKLKSLVREGHINKNNNGQYSRKSIDLFINRTATQI